MRNACCALRVSACAVLSERAYHQSKTQGIYEVRIYQGGAIISLWKHQVPIQRMLPDYTDLLKTMSEISPGFTISEWYVTIRKSGVPDKSPCTTAQMLVQPKNRIRDTHHMYYILPSCLTNE